jgi:hypothetical protein
MDTHSATALIRTADNCRCGIVLFDETGRITVLNPDFLGTENLKIEKGSQLSDELNHLAWGRMSRPGSTKGLSDPDQLQGD